MWWHTIFISLDCGANNHFAARCPRRRAGKRLTGAGMLATMAPGMSHAIAAQLANPRRQSVAIVGDGGFGMLMAEVSIAAAHNLLIKVVLLKNNTLAEVKFEQKEIGNPEYVQLAGRSAISVEGFFFYSHTLCRAVVPALLGIGTSIHSAVCIAVSSLPGC
jgi:thiamine pyrophosphate-dependent acetolactate synthase large subunit-like protein